MKRLISIFMAFAIVMVILTAAGAQVKGSSCKIVLQIDNALMKVNGEEQEIERGMGTKPIIKDGRTLVPIRAIIEALGGTVEWDNTTKAVALTYNEQKMQLFIDSTDALVNGEKKTMDVAPVVIDGRTMLPIRFVAENFSLKVKWDGTEQTITIGGEEQETINIDAVLAESRADKNIILHFGEPESKGQEHEEAYTGFYYQEWEYKSQGLVFRMCREYMGGEQTVDTYSVEFPATVVTSKGIKIGSTRQEVENAYSNEIEENTSESILVGSIYDADAVLFSLKNDIVTRIYVGAMGE